ncbi:Carboxylic ester hydrolase [Coniochaeta hoffmannii]|uniref:Carboxylic ester hydrolase n=1 Tax=Coniochaeta hoffmannii TaxID=91930 RepID=A0AA38VUX4_9PEZI|nr:Carboxylic ester hydrolase [Coniochaeta hoffmannii]
MARVTGAVATLIALALRAVALPAEADSTTSSQPRCVASKISCLLPKGATLESVTAVPDGGSYGEGAKDIAYPVVPTGLPELCAVIVKVTSSPTSSYHFGLFLPSKWNSKFLTVGNGGFAGGINWLDMAPGPHYGMATVSTDLGHNSTTTDLSWALNNEEARKDWGWRAIHGSVEIGKQIVQGYYKKAAKKSYYSGCSTGGRQGLKELQLFPDSFDGLLIGAPSYYVTHINNAVTKVGIYNLPVDAPNHIPYTVFPYMADEIVRQCDALDGLADGIIQSPELCNIDFSAMACGTSANATWCLTPPQIQTARNIYGDYRFSDGRLIYPGLTPGSEDQWWILLAGTEPTPFGVGYQKFFLTNNPDWDWRTYNDSMVTLAERTDPGQPTAIDYDISAFKRRGGKLIMYHGLADGLVATKGSDWYYNSTVSALGGLRNTRDFFRYFQVPGMQHCLGTTVDAPWSFAGASQPGQLGTGAWSVPGFADAGHDAMLALQDWVEKGREVDQIVATTWRSSLDPGSGVLRQRPVCPWPQKAVYKGRGDKDAANSWSCR